MVTLETYSSLPEASIVQGMLEANGIHAVVSDNNNPYVPYFGGVALMVPEEDAKRARQLLDEHGD